MVSALPISCERSMPIARGASATPRAGACSRNTRMRIAPGRCPLSWKEENSPAVNIVILGLSITSSWGNGHATTWRALVRELAANGHDVVFLERDLPWYADNRDMPEPDGCTAILYRSFYALKRSHARRIADADLVIIGSYVKQGVEVAEWVMSIAQGIVAFYDIDTPVSLAKLRRGDHEYLSPVLIPRFDLSLSFTSGPTLRRIEREFGSPMARPLYCSFDPDRYYPEERDVRWGLGYLGTYSDH